MTKRTAILMASGLVLALASGTMALWMGRAIVGASATAPAKAPKPVVKVVTQEVTVHEQLPAPGGSGPQTVTIVRRVAPTGAASGEFDDELEGRGGDD